MTSFRQVFFGILTAMVAVGIVLGGFILAFTEENPPVALLATPEPGFTSIPLLIEPTPIPTLQFTPSIGFVVTQTPNETPFPAQENTPVSPTTSSPTSCQYPSDWSTIIVQPGETLASIAHDYGTTTSALIQANCLINESLIADSRLYVPRLPPTPPPISCGPPAGWTTYTVQQGDTLTKISQLFRTSVPQLRAANCMGSSSLIRIGQKLSVPNVPISTAPPPIPTLPTLPPPPTDPAPEPTSTVSPPDTLTPEPLPTSTAPSTPIPPTEEPTPLPPPPTETEPPPDPTATEAPPALPTPTEPAPTEEATADSSMGTFAPQLSVVLEQDNIAFQAYNP